MKKSIFFLFCFLVLLQGCMYAIRYDGTYKGKVVDEATREPLEDVVVLGVWYKETPTVAGAVSSYYDARETVTDKNGEFEIPGKGLRIMTDLAPIRVSIFKAGYTFAGGQWDTLDQVYGLGKKIKWEGKKPIIPLRKLTLEERRERRGDVDKENFVPDKKQRLWIKEVNKDRKDRGVPPYPEED